MECNKEEAIRAKSIAENKMQGQDFEGGLKIALKAQRLFPDLESISRIITVCEVHCAAGTKIGGEIDWYGVLQVEMTADEPTIRKQYRKLALLLHPDKNKLDGAEGAFQLVGDAYKILSDPEKRSQLNMTRRANFSRVSLDRPARQSYRSVKKQGTGVSSTAAKSNFAHFSGLNQNQPSPFVGAGTFWTMCPSCSVRFQYYQNVLNRQVCCQKCFNRFVAYDLKTAGVTSAGNAEKVGNAASFTCQKTDCVDASSIEFQKAKSDYPAFERGFKSEHNPEFFGEFKSDARDAKLEDCLSKCNDMKFQNVQLHSIHNRDQEAKPPSKQKRGGIEDNRTPELSAEKASNVLRISNRHKKNVTGNEVHDAYIDSSPRAFKRSRQAEKQTDRSRNSNAFSGVVADGGTKKNKNKRIHSDFNASVASRSKTSFDQENLIYPSPEFCDFESERCENKFAVDQIWALYDNIDGMPRFYAHVRKVYSREFKLQLNWLENNPSSIAEMKWTEQGLPVACGIFKHGKSYNTHERHIFSHLVSWRKGMKRNSYVIYPKRGEIWAVFKNWDVRWSSEPDNHRAYEYQIMEAVSDFTEVDGISVIRLARIKEFMALFIRTSDAEGLLEIPAKNVLMFSHRIPACRVTEKQEYGVPEGAFELDCAALPANFQVTLPSISLECRTTTMNVNVPCNNVFSENKILEPSMVIKIKSNEQDAMEKWKAGTRGPASLNINGASETVYINSDENPDTSTVTQKELETETMTTENEVVAEADSIGSQNPDTKNHSVSPSLLTFEYPESEFYDFESDRLLEKVECGQVWAFYCEIDSFPRYYGKIRMVDRKNNKVHVTWLDFYSAVDADDRRVEDELPPGCGPFRAIQETCIMDSGQTFSHQVKAKPISTRDHYYIFPDAGEVWAIFKDWSANWSASDIKKSEFELVEISACDASGIKALVLTKVNGYVSVFSRESKGLDTLKFIPFDECSRFSHQIPAFKLKKEMGRSGYWELDPAAVPAVFLASK